MNENFIVVTTNDIGTKEIEAHIGLAHGSTDRSRNKASDLYANQKKINGGE